LLVAVGPVILIHHIRQVLIIDVTDNSPMAVGLLCPDLQKPFTNEPSFAAVLRSEREFLRSVVEGQGAGDDDRDRDEVQIA